MKQVVTIRTNANEDLKPLVAAALRNQLTMLRCDVEASLGRIAVFEATKGMSSEEFERKLNSNEIEETLDVLDWKMELASLRLLQRKVQAIINAEVS